MTRDRLLTKLPALSDLVAEHQERCSYRKVGILAERIKNSRNDGRGDIEALLEIVRYDQSLRQVTVERTRLDKELLDFLFGSPLVDTLRRFKIKLSREGGRITVVPAF